MTTIIAGTRTHTQYSEVEASLSTIHSLTQNHPDIFSKSSASETIQAQDELRGTLSMLETDVEDLEESVRVVEDMGERWGLGANEVHKRRDFVQRVKREVEVGQRVSKPDMPDPPLTASRAYGIKSIILEYQIRKVKERTMLLDGTAMSLQISSEEGTTKMRCGDGKHKNKR